MTTSPTAPYMRYLTRYAVPSPWPSRSVRAEDAEYTITAPPASRQNVAVRSRRCSSGCWRDLAIRPRFDSTPRTPPGGNRRTAPSGSGQRLEVVAALVERAVLVVGRARGREQHDVARSGCRAGGGDRLLADQVRRAAALRERRRERRIVLLLAAAAEDRVDAAGERADADDRRGDV